MNRRYALLCLVVLATTARAQFTSEAPNQHLHQLEESLQQQGYKIFFRQSNTDGISITRYWETTLRVLGSPDIYKPMPDNVIAQRQQRLEQALGSIRAAFTTLSRETTESQLYEYHKNGADTIEYAVGLGNTQSPYAPPRSTFNAPRSTFNAHAYEAANFSYRKNADGHDASLYSHTHRERLGVAPADRCPFDIVAFEAHVQPALAPVMALKGAYSCPIYWRHDEGFHDDVNGGLYMTYFYDGNSGAGLATGTRYFIPAQYKAEANTMFRQLDSLALDYADRHRDQPYTYFHQGAMPYPAADDESRWYVYDTFNGSILHSPRSGKGKNYALLFHRRDDGLHILSLTSEGEAWMPREWYRIKSYVNGRLVYLKSAEHDGRRQAVATAVAARQWHIDITAMNTMRYGSRVVSPDFFLELHGDTLRSYLPYLGEAHAAPLHSPSMGLNFQAPVISYKKSRPKSKRDQIDIDVKTREDTYHYVIVIDDDGAATIRVRSLNSDPISFDGIVAP